MRYFKHFSNAFTSIKLQELKDKLGFEGMGRYWALLELLNEKYDGTETTIKIHLNEVSTRLGYRFNKSSKSFIDTLNMLEIVSITSESISTITLSCPILSELMDRDSKRNTALRVDDASKNKNKIENKNNNKKESERVNTELTPSLSLVKTLKEEDKIKLDELISLFNEKLANKGLIRTCYRDIIPPSAILDFQEISTKELFRDVNTWAQYFDIVSCSSYLTNKFPASFSWLMKHENACKVLSGNYQDERKVV